MSLFPKFLKVNVLEESQYRANIISGTICQFFFGLFYIVLYMAFFESGIQQDFSCAQMATYIWLGQAFFAIFCFHDVNKAHITKKILSGDVSYQLLKPINLYDYWLMESMTRSLSMALYRSVPIIIIASLLPSGYALIAPVSVDAFAIFVCALIAGWVLINIIKIFSYICILYTMDAYGVFAISIAVCSLLAGSVIPIPMMPVWLQNVLSFLPFRYSSDLAYRVYIGNIGITDGVIQMGIQIIWIVGLYTLGKILMNNKSKKLVVQGG